MAFMVKLGKCKKGIELGVFTGYSSLCFAEVLPEDGKLVSIDVNPDFTALAQKYWKLAKVDHKIDLRLEGGITVLDEFLSDPDQKGTFDFAYVDADKENYGVYFDKLVELLRVGGFIMFDNVLWHGKVTNEDTRKDDPNATALYETVEKAMNDKRVKVHTILLADGLAIVEKVHE